MTMNGPAALLKDVMRTSILMTELQHAAVQLRLVAVLLATSMLFDMLAPALLLLAGADSIVLRAAAGTSLHAYGVGALFVALAVAMLPYLALQLGAWPRARRGLTKFTCLALALSGVLWAFLAWRCAHMDIGAAASLVFTRNALGALTFSVALAFSLNAEQLRTLLDCPAS